MAVRINPFHELYAGESVSPDKFVKLFSDIIVEHALALFQPGHVILKGLPGSGKSMLLNLLKPSIRLAYDKAREGFPVPADLSRYVGAGINLRRSGISDFGQRQIGDEANNESISPLFFADFLNYWVVSDILHSIRKLSSEASNADVIRSIGIDYSPKKIDSFARKLVKLDCWYGYLNAVNSFIDLQQEINDRITNYRAYLNYNKDDLPKNIRDSKSLIGVPVSQTVQLLKEMEIIGSSTEVYIRIDQYEELAWLDDASNGLGTSYQEVIHKLLGMRDTNVSYRIGTRNFAWDGDKKMYGSAAVLERKRNYKEISIDSVLKRPENRRTWIFPKFAEDIFARRIELSPYRPFESRKLLISEVFGTRINPFEAALQYVPSDHRRAILLEPDWPEKWKDFLNSLADVDPLSARLAEAWARQRDKQKIIYEDKWVKPYPWERKDKIWWKKERTEQALMQIASRNRQHLIWYGKEDILGLSGGYILSFLSLCQHIWDVWIRDTRNELPDVEMRLPKFDSVIQTAGIRETSRDWFDDILKQKGGRDRKVFIDYLGTLFYRNLVEDKAMTYPGKNGFSLTVEDLKKNNKIDKFINDACDYGDLYDAPHTSKNLNEKGRKKFYLNPILSPYFKIPYAHTKEPDYAKLKEVATWLVECRVFQKSDFPEIFIEKHKSRADNSGQGVIDFK